MVTGIGCITGIVRCYSANKRNRSNVQRYEIRDMNGMVVGSYSVRKSSGSSKKLKKFQYSFKKISAQILKTKTSSGAKMAVSAARRQVALLKRRLKTGEYDDRELEIAIVHAEKMERVARKRMKHFQEEERAKKGGGILEDELEEKEELDMESALAEEAQSSSEEQPDVSEAMQQIIEEIMREMEISMEEMRRAMEENMDELMETMGQALEETGLDELSEELMGGAAPDMDSKDLEDLKRKHRLEEMRDIAEADAKYLKALFEKLESDKQSAASSIAFSGVSLELGGMDMPVPETVPAADIVEGAVVDMSV